VGDFLTFLSGFAFVYGCGVGLICAACAGGIDPTFCDPMNARNHWRGHLQVAAAAFVIGVLGQVVRSVV
jgi:hypothetical protein